jgi:hypothetical protein
MKANPGGTVTGTGIIGRRSELAEIWSKLLKRSVLLSAERRVGKTSLLRKMCDEPIDGWTPILVLVESARHPIECVEAIYQQATSVGLRTNRHIWLKRAVAAYQKVASTEVHGWKLPQFQADWRNHLKSLVEHIVEHSETGVVIMIDEFPLMIWNFADDHGAPLAMQFLDSLREIRQQFEATGKLRFVLSGSIGFHLVLQHLKLSHDYKGAPTNDMHPFILTGMSPGDTELMCQCYLDDENIERKTPEAVAHRMHFRTDGLPLYIQYVCEAIQDGKMTAIEPADIDRILDALLDHGNVSWFRDAAERIEAYYSKFKFNGAASVILNRLSIEECFLPEEAILNAVRATDATAEDQQVKRVIELLTNDNYIVRDTSSGKRSYRFRYRLMREWWKINQA